VVSLRSLVAVALIGDGTNPWADRVVETAGATADEHLPWMTGGQQPWIVVRGGPTTLGPSGGARVTQVEVWPHGPMSAWSGIDNLETLCVDILDQQVVATPAGATEPDGYLLSYEGTPLGDQVVAEWDAWTRPLRFGAARLGWFGPDDPRAARLRALTPGLLCGDWPCVQTDPATWVPTDDCPGIYWRPDAGPAEIIRYANFTLYQETLACHIVAPGRAARDAWTDRVALALPGDCLDAQVPPATMLLRLVSENLYAEPMADGQLRVQVQFSETACDWSPDDPPLIEALAIPGIPPGGPSVFVRRRGLSEADRAALWRGARG